MVGKKVSQRARRGRRSRRRGGKRGEFLTKSTEETKITKKRGEEGRISHKEHGGDKDHEEEGVGTENPFFLCDLFLLCGLSVRFFGEISIGEFTYKNSKFIQYLGN